jgi:hypothetical protein
MTHAWPGPADVDEQTLTLGPELGSGGQGRVRRVEGQGEPLVFKEYKVSGADPGALKLLVDFPATLQLYEREFLQGCSAWPLARVFKNGQVSGFLMREIPAHFMAPNSAGSLKMREVQYLVYDRKPMWGDNVPAAGISAQARISVATAFVELMSMLHAKTLVIGDVSMNNVLWTTRSEDATEIFLIDCDGIRGLGSRPVLPQADTLDWNDPRQKPQAGPDMDTDRYKIALLVGRVLSAAAYLRPGEPLRPVPGVPARMAARLAVLWQRAAGPCGTRPAASQWSMALSNRDEIPMRVPGPVRERYPSMISKAELQPDSNTSRPVIPMSPPQAPGPPAPQSPQPTRPTITFRPPSQQPGAQP